MAGYTSLCSLAGRLRSGALSAHHAVAAALDAIRAGEALNAWVLVPVEAALTRAAELDTKRAASGPTGPLHGVPLAIKDNIDQAGLVCSAGSRAYQDRIPLKDAPVVTRLETAGAVIVGRTNMHELADGVTSENAFYGPVVNPHRPGFHPGGSSGGSAVAVAAGHVPGALGTDTGGSVRIPASLCGIVGYKPSWGRVPTARILPLSTFLDHVGVLARSVEDTALLAAVIARDPGLSPESLDRLEADGSTGAALRLGVLSGFDFEPDPEVTERFESALKTLEKQGHTINKVTVPRLARGVSLLSAIYAPEAYHTHERRLHGRPDDFSPEVRADLARGEKLPKERHEQALEEAEQLRPELAEAASAVDLLLCPTTPHPARPFGSPEPHTYLRYTCPFNLTGQPALSLPMGRVDGLPVGLQLIGAEGEDARLLAAARRVEAALENELNPSA
jgi:aspartyl-tRNA(Asn)/glutamyl-tRNA(Gln) amidotransferase subunit A